MSSFLSLQTVILPSIDPSLQYRHTLIGLRPEGGELNMWAYALLFSEAGWAATAVALAVLAAGRTLEALCGGGREHGQKKR